MTSHRIQVGWPKWLQWCTSTVLRCHVVGTTTAIALILCTAWVWSRREMKVSTIQCGDDQIDLADAVTLIENADQWRELFTVNYQQAQRLDERVAAIATWLPRQVDWNTLEQNLRSDAESSGLVVASIARGKRHPGTRVGVVTAICEVRGSYESLCRFLSSLGDRPQPIACSEIQLHRIHQNNEANSDRDPVSNSHIPAPICRATLSLRIPFAAAGTASAKLLDQETGNAI